MRPLPPYPGSYDPQPTTDSSAEDLLKRYGVSKPTFFKRRDALVERGWVNPTRVGQRVWYSPEDVFVLDQVAYWCDNNYSLSEVVAHLTHTAETFHREEPVGAVEVQAETTTTDLVVKGLNTSAQELSRLGEDFVQKVAQSVGDAVKRAVPRDVLVAHDFLKKAAENNYQLSGRIMAEGLGLKTASVGSWPDRKEVHGFICRRIGRGVWVVTQCKVPEETEGVV